MRRAYYAAYHLASVFVRANALIPPTEHLTHDRVWRLVRQSHRPDSEEIADLGYVLRNARVGADYRNPFPGDLTREAAKAIANSATIISWLQVT